MIITFGTQKGGVGKTTIAIALSNYLVVERKKKLHIYDFDFQQSFYQKWTEDNELYDDKLYPKLYDVYCVKSKEDLPFKTMDDILKMRQSDEVFLFDLGGKLDAQYTDLLIWSNVIVVPIEYSDLTVHSTFTFLNLLPKLESQASLIFVRSKYDKNFFYPNQEHTDSILVNYGELLERPVYKRNILQKINTRFWTKPYRDAIKKNLIELTYTINEISETAI